MAVEPRAEAVIDLGAIRTSVAALAAYADTAQVMAVVKADGYGHGALASAQAALDGGATWLGVALVEEAVELRQAGIAAPMLVLMEPPPGAAAAALAHDVDIAVGSRETLDAAASAARTHGKAARVHLKVDTGLTRGGATTGDWSDLVGAAAKLESDQQVDVVGVWSHLACADQPGHPSIDAQASAFQEALVIADGAGLNPRARHLANSAATLTRPDLHFDLVRAGIACYGLSPLQSGGTDVVLSPAMSLRARVALAKRVPSGTGVSYGHTYSTADAVTVVLVPLGYADGVPRAAGNSTQVWIAGRRRTISGTVCMDQFVVDVGDDDVRAGDEVVLFGSGSAGEPTAQDWANALGTINYEIVTRIGARVPRLYVGGAA